MNRSLLKLNRSTLVRHHCFSVPLGDRGRDEGRGSTGSKQNRIEIKDFAFNPQTITVKSGEKMTWINRDEEPHTIVSVGKQFKKSTALDTDQEFTITAGAPGTYDYFCSVHPKMTGTIVVEEITS